MIEWQGIRILTCPKFLHAGDHVHLGPGVTTHRKINPAIDLRGLPAPDCILLSHYHGDHFDQLVEKSLSRTFNIITTPHAKECLTSDGWKKDPFQPIHELDFFDMMLHIDRKDPSHSCGYEQVPAAKERKCPTAMPGKHVPPGPPSKANDLLTQNCAAS